MRHLKTSLTFSLLLALLAGQAALPVSAARAPAPAVINFSGYQWDVRSGAGGPGPNKWSAANVWLDASGYLHLRVSQQAGQWYAAELYSTRRFGFGIYQFQVEGLVDRFDPNIVLGLFNYPPPAVGPDGTNEIDIEYSRWGNPAYPIGNYTVWPALAGLSQKSRAFNFTLTSSRTTQRFTWVSQMIVFRSLRGFTDGNTGQYAGWVYQPGVFLNYVPQQAMPVHINLWLFQGHPPVNGRPVEIVIRNFKFTPLP